MKESVVQSLRTLAVYLLIGLPILIIVTRTWLPEQFDKPEFNMPWKQELVTLDQEFTGKWKFSILDNPEWKEAGFDDQNWEELDAPGNWESQGFEGYNGYAWYRKAIKIDPELRNKHLALHLGKIDDVDEVYIDGQMVGRSGQFPPGFATAYNKDRIYQLSPKQTAQPGFTIAIRVFDADLDGGFIVGPLGLKVQEAESLVQIPLQGIWKFKTSSKHEDFAEVKQEEWTEIYVPSTWEEQGFYEYDGYALYQKEFEIAEEEVNESWVLVLGKIDDLDHTYLNGELVGSTGSQEAWDGNLNGMEWQKERAYPLPANILKKGTNTLTVKVFDGLKNGGIFQGPIGLVRAEDYTSFWKKIKGQRLNVYFNSHEETKGKHLWCQN